MSAKRKNWEVGSTWYAEPISDQRQTYMPSGYRCSSRNPVSLLSTCRSAIEYVLGYINKTGVAVVPAFTCHSVISPFLNKGYKVQGYPINNDLTINWESMMTMLDDLTPSVVLIHGYFGLDNINNSAPYIKTLREKGITIIEDMTQNMFSSFTDIGADFNVGSVRKWFPIPDGAFISNVLVDNPDEDSELAEAKSAAMMAKQKYIYNNVGGKDEFMPMFSTAERILDSRNRPYAISSVSKNFLRSVDWEEFNRRRRNNYKFLSTRLSSHPEIQVIQPELSAQEVPFLLPVLIDHNRFNFQKYMAANNVYPTIIWKCPEEFEETIDPITKEIYDTILCFHIDQRYDMEDIKRVADIVDSYFY